MLHRYTAASARRRKLRFALGEHGEGGVADEELVTDLHRKRVVFVVPHAEVRPAGPPDVTQPPVPVAELNDRVLPRQRLVALDRDRRTLRAPDRERLRAAAKHLLSYRPLDARQRDREFVANQSRL